MLKPPLMRPLRFFTPLAVLLVLFSARQALAIQYETEINIEEEQDLYELNARGAISDDTLEALVDLLRTGVDLSTASRDDLYELPGLTYDQVDRILEYRRLATRIDDPVDLVRANILTPPELQRIAPFIVVREPGTVVPISGKLTANTTYIFQDPYAPPAFFQARLKGPLGFSAGLLAVTTRQKMGPLQWDESRQALTATAPHYGFELPKLFIEWKGVQSKVIAGSYRIGFGERLTLDNTSRQTPNGIYSDYAVLRLQRVQSSFCRFSGATAGDPDCSPEEENLYITPDYRWRTGFRGLAGRVEELRIGSTSVALTGFASYQERSLYQYATYNPENCDDPHADNLSACAAPPVYLRQPDGSVASTRFAYGTLPSLFNEAAGGGNATITFAPGKRMGITGYYAQPLFNVPHLDFQEYAPYPYGGGFGAVGVDGALSFGHLNLFGEVSRSFDSEPQGARGGFGAVQRSVYSFEKHELELSLRYYDANFINPYARAVAEPDRLDGQRVRNEAGVRLRHYGKVFPDLYTRLDGDLWTNPADGSTPNSAGTLNFRGGARVDYAGFLLFSPGLWVDYRNKGLGTDPNDALVCYEVSTETDSEGDAIPCTGQYFRVIERLELLPKFRYANLLLQLSEKWVDDPTYPDGMRMDLNAFVQLTSRPVDVVRLRARVKYLDEAIDDPAVGERSVWSFVEAAWMPAQPPVLVALRYDNFFYLDQRKSTALRVPNPANRLTLQLEAKF